MSVTLQFLLVLAIIVLVAKYAGALSVRWGQPAVFGTILAGLILGPTFLNILGWPIFLSPEVGAEAVTQVEHVSPVFEPIKLMAELGVILLMFLAGLETDLRQMMRVGGAALWAAVGGVLGPLFFGSGAAYLFMRLGLPFTAYEAIFIGTILTATSVSISAQTLMELKAIRSKEGVTILGAAVIDDVLGILLLSFVIAFKPTGGILAPKTHLLDWVMELLREFPAVAANPGPWRMGALVLLMLFSVALAVLIWRFLLVPFLRHLGSQPVAEGLLAAAVVAGLFFAWMAEFIGNLAAITGSYVVGVLIALSDLREQVTAKVHTLTYGMFVSIFFVSIGLTADARTIFAPLVHLSRMTRVEWLMLIFTLLIVLIAVLTKVGGCLLGARATGFSWLESYRVGVGMISRGEVGLIVAAVGFSAGVIGVEVFSVMILMVLVTTLVTPVWLRAVIPPGGKDDSADHHPPPAPAKGIHRSSSR